MVTLQGQKSERRSTGDMLFAKEVTQAGDVCKKYGRYNYRRQPYKGKVEYADIGVIEGILLKRERGR